MHEVPPLRLNRLARRAAELRTTIAAVIAQDAAVELLQQKREEKETQDAQVSSHR